MTSMIFIGNRFASKPVDWSWAECFFLYYSFNSSFDLMIRWSKDV